MRRRAPTPRTLLVLLGVLVVLLAVPAASAAPPIETTNFRVHATEGTERNAARIAGQAEERRARLCRMLDSCDLPTRPIDIWLAPEPEEFAAAFHGETPMAEWAVGVAFVRERRIVLRAWGSSLFSLDETFDHEVSHILVHDAAGGRVPRWFTEGVAIWQAGEPVLDRLMQAQRAAVMDNLLPLSELDDRFPIRGAAVGLAYAEAALFVHWLEREHGLAALPGLLRRMRAGEDFDSAFAAAFGEPLAAAEARWLTQLEDAGGGLATLFGDPNALWGVMSLLFLLVAAARYRQQKLALAAMADEEVEADLALQDASDESVAH